MLSRIFGTLIVLFYLYAGPAENWPLAVDATIDFIAFVLVLVATFGRLWALAYISGHKTRDLITHGPYSIVRNPLYSFSFIGIIGLGLVSKNMTILAVLCALFVLYYPFVIRGEENNLARVHGKTFEEYRAKTPMVIPRFSLYHDHEHSSIDTRLFRRSFFSAMWFPLFYLILLFFERLHDSGMI